MLACFGIGQPTIERNCAKFANSKWIKFLFNKQRSKDIRLFIAMIFGTFPFFVKTKKGRGKKQKPAIHPLFVNRRLNPPPQYPPW